MTRSITRRGFSAVFILLALVSPALAEKSCHYKTGIARWGIKTSMPDDPTVAAKPVDLASLLETPNPILNKQTLKEMRTMRLAHSFEIQSGGGTVSLQEGDKIRVSGHVIGAACDADGDIHLSMAAGDSSQCLIVEVPDPDQVDDDGLKALVNPARTVVLGYLNDGAPTSEVTVEGQFFIDTDHLARAQMGRVGPDAGGGRGVGKCAVNVWEVHPVTLIQ